MSAGIIIRICLEVAAVLLLVVGYLHEEQLIAFEDRMLEKLYAAENAILLRAADMPQSAARKKITLQRRTN